MDKNSFLIYNDLIKHLYECDSLESLLSKVLKPLQMLIPYSYASILLANKNINNNSLADATDLYQPEPLCIPESFCEAEKKYISRAKDDPILWLMHGNESTLVCESDILDDETRLSGDLYLSCYKAYHIYDTLQFSIVYDKMLLGVLTLFRTRIDGKFSQEDLFYLRSFGSHLNTVFAHILSQKADTKNDTLTLEQLQTKYQLTRRECEVLSLLFAFYSNDEIAEAMNISEHTAQKHIQNILRKTNAASRLELLKRFHAAKP